MKKVLIVLGIVVIGAAAAAYFYSKSAKLAIDSILPAQPLVYVNVSDIEKRLAEFQKTKLWRKVSKIDGAMLLEKSGASAQDIVGYEKFVKGFTSSLSNPLLAKMFGQEVALAIYPGSSVKTPQEAVSGTLLVTRLKPEAKFIEFVSSLYAKMDKKIVTSQDKYKNLDVTTLELDKGFNIVYVQIKDLLVIGFDKKQVTAAIDVSSRSAASLAGDSDYRATFNQLFKPAHTFIYADMRACAKAFESSVEAISKLSGTGSAQARQAEEMRAFQKFSGFRTIGVSMTDGDVDKSKFVVLFDKTKLEPIIAKTYSVKPIQNTTARFIPKESLWYQWSCFDPKVTWESFMSDEPFSPQANRGPAPADIVKGIEGALNLSIEKDVIGAIGNEGGNALINIDLNGPFPVPGIMLFVKVNNKAEFEKLITSLLEKNNFPTSVEDYKNKNIKYAVLPFGENLQPGFCFLDNYFLIATSHKVLKSCIDAQENQAASLLSDKDFQSVNFGLTDRANGVNFIKVSALLERLKGVGDWYVGLATLIASSSQSYQKAGEMNAQLLKDAIAKLETELADMESKEAALKKELAASALNTTDSVEKQAALDALGKEIRSVKQALDNNKTELVKLSSTQAPAARKDMDPKLLKLYMDELVYPILEGLKMIKAVSSVATFKDNMVESLSYTKISN